MSFQPPLISEVVDFVISIGGHGGAGKYRDDDTRITDVTALHKPFTDEDCFSLSWWNGKRPIPPEWEYGALIASPDDNFRAVEDPPRGVGFVIFHRKPRLAMAKVLDRFFKGYHPPYWRRLGELRREELSKSDPSGFALELHDFLEQLSPKERALVAQRYNDIRCTWGLRCTIRTFAREQLEGQALVWDRSDDRHQWFEFPHLYGVRIGDDVTIGAGSTIQRGVLHDTVIGNDVKIGQSVNIGHGCEIGDHTVIAAHACLGGSVVVGPYCTIGMNATIRNGVTLGEDVIVGMGAVVLDDVPAYTTVFGNPAHVHGPLRNGRRKLDAV